MRRIDFHAHVLPEIDDGAANVEESRQILLSQREQGIDIVVATPHYCDKTPIGDFIKQREASLALLRASVSENTPKIVTAAEVEIYYGMSEEEDLRALCIENTDYMLIELPLVYWNGWIYDELFKLISIHGIYPVIAHLDRYALQAADIKKFEQLLSMEVLVQINADSLLHFSSRKIVKKLMKLDAFTVLGSDCHDSHRRACRFEQACKVIQKKWGNETLETILYHAEAILNNQRVERNIYYT